MKAEDMEKVNSLQLEKEIIIYQIDSRENDAVPDYLIIGYYIEEMARYKTRGNSYEIDIGLKKKKAYGEFPKKAKNWMAFA